MVTRRRISKDDSGSSGPGFRTIWSLNIPTIGATAIVLTIQAVLMYGGINNRVAGLELSLASTAKAAEVREGEWGPKVNGLLVSQMKQDTQIDLLTDSLKEQRAMNERILAQLTSVREDLSEVRAKVEPDFRRRGR